MALALVVLVSAGLLLRSFVTLTQVDPGFSKSNVALLQVFAYGERYSNDAQRLAFFDLTADRFRSVPGVETVGLVSAMPFLSANIVVRGPFRVEGRPSLPESDLPTTSLTVATGDYFSAMRIKIRSGRLFSNSDHGSAPLVAMVNDLTARTLWPAESPLNQRISVRWQGRWRTMEVVGVVDSVRHDGLDR
ncbi:MAG: ABC transporter permease, partial [Vicinamibacterales bacterium]